MKYKIDLHIRIISFLFMLMPYQRVKGKNNRYNCF